MTEDTFWDIINTLDWSKEESASVLEFSIQRLAQMTESDIQSFQNILSEKLYHLDGRAYAINSVAPEESISADLFLYARCAVVANGRVFYENVMHHPVFFPKDLFFEDLLYLSGEAWKRKTGTAFEYLPEYIYETGFNPNGWGADTIVL